ncbi:hypothetical protein HDU97_010417 [Phlyctochytrium planicorne]|nr:hypothetical protein HDU97_010417 [Phlyctochytrium planicorne]
MRGLVKAVLATLLSRSVLSDAAALSPNHLILPRDHLVERDDDLSFDAPDSSSSFYEYGKAFTFCSDSSLASDLQTTSNGLDKAFKVSTSKLQNSWDVIKTGYNTVVQTDVGSTVAKSGVCSLLPLQYNTKYRWINIPGSGLSQLNSFAISSVPFYKQNLGDAFGMIIDVASMAVGLCIVYNKDAMIDNKPFKIGLSGFGLSWRNQGTLNYTSSNLNVWTGYNGLNPPQASLAANVWTRLYLEARVFEGCTKCSMYTYISVFTGVNTSQKKYTAGINVEEITFGFSIFPVATLGSGFGVWRLDESNSTKGGDDICNPSGIFFSVQKGISLPLLDSALKKYLHFTYTDLTTYDLYFAFRPVDGMNSAGFRFTKQLKILNFNLGTTDIEVQYLTQREVTRRKTYYGTTNPCKITCKSYDSKGICSDSASGIRAVDTFILDKSGVTDYVLLTAEYSSNIDFAGSVALSITSAKFYFAASPDNFASSVYLYVYAKLKVLFVTAQLYLTATSNLLTFEVDTNVELASFNVKGYTDISKNYQDSTTQGLDKNSWSVTVTAKLSQFLKNAEAFVSTEVHAFAKKCSAAWKSAKSKILDIAKDIENFFIGDNAPLKYLASEYRALAKDVTSLVKGIKTFAKNFEKFGNSEVKALANCGDAILSGNPDKAFDALGEVFTNLGDAIADGFKSAFGKSSKSSVVDADGTDKYGCNQKKVKTVTCTKVFGISVKCKTKYGTPYSDPDCLVKIATAASECRTKAENAANRQTIVDNSKAKLPAISVIADSIDAGSTFTLPAGSVSPLVINLDGAVASAANTIASFSPTLTVMTQKLSTSGSSALDNASTTTFSLSGIKLAGTGVDESNINTQLKNLQSGFNANVKTYVMNGQNTLDNDVVSIS